MTIEQGDLALLNEPVAQELLISTNPARLAYNWTDGTPRVVPIWFHWNGETLVLSSPEGAPKIKALSQNPQVALTIDDNTFPWKVLLIRGDATVQLAEAGVPEYAAAAKRYLGEEGGEAWIQQMAAMGLPVYRIEVRPTWVGILDFQERMPSAIADAVTS